jgi:hypothetical protein
VTIGLFSSLMYYLIFPTSDICCPVSKLFQLSSGLTKREDVSQTSKCTNGLTTLFQLQTYHSVELDVEVIMNYE